MWVDLGPSCPDCPFSEELGDTKVNTWVCEAVLNLGTGPIPLREGVNNPRVWSLRPSLDYLCQFWFLNVFVFLCRVSGMFAMPHDGGGGFTLPEDMVRREVNRVYSKPLQARRQRRWAWSMARA
jgi:hypothetical protein